VNSKLALRCSILFLLLNPQLICAAPSTPPSNRSTLQPQTKPPMHKIDSEYLRIAILPGWTAHEDSDRKTLNLVRGNYYLSIDPIFEHVSGIIGGRFSEVFSGMESVDAVMRNVEGPAGGFECANITQNEIVVTKEFSLQSFYTSGPSKVDHGCIFPSGRQSVWFGSSYVGISDENEYKITLTYLSADVNKLPRRSSAQLKHVFAETAQMLKTLVLKPPVVISRIDPPLAPPGATVTIYGHGFHILDASVVVLLRGKLNKTMSPPIIDDDGTSLTFAVPSSIQTISCPAGSTEIDEGCVPTPQNHVEISECPHQPSGALNFCGKPISSGTYTVSLSLAGHCVLSNAVPLTVAAFRTRPVSISLLYPSALVSRGDMITVRGAGFTPTNNTAAVGPLEITEIRRPTARRSHSQRLLLLVRVSTVLCTSIHCRSSTRRAKATGFLFPTGDSSIQVARAV
jgi:hypothetical protein